MTETGKILILVLISAIIMIAVAFVDPVAQDQQYHQFADQGTYFKIPNTVNVISNLFFALAGLAGLLCLYIQRSLVVIESIFPVYVTFFVSLVVIAPGSAYYHWMPNNQSLVWDRLPITLAFMSFFTLILAERISLKFAKIIFLPLIIIGVLSIVYWHYSELAGDGDLRPYGLVQFLPMLLIPIILLMFDAKFTYDSGLWWFLGCYLIAKGLESFDEQIFNLLVVISGHSLKHLIASLGCLIYLRYLHRRTPTEINPHIDRADEARP
jgi:hypothetical protein